MVNGCNPKQNAGWSTHLLITRDSLKILEFQIGKVMIDGDFMNRRLVIKKKSIMFFMLMLCYGILWD